MRIALPLARVGTSLTALFASNTNSDHDPMHLFPRTDVIDTMDTSIDSLHKTCASRIEEILPPLNDNQRRIYLIRHGETDWNTLGKIQGGGYDMELNINGQIQATSVANVLAELSSNVEIQVVVSSHLERSEQTANIITKALQNKQKYITGGNHKKKQQLQRPVKRVISQKFGEMRFGEFEGLSTSNHRSNVEVDRFHTFRKAMLRDDTISWPNGGESIIDVRTRGVSGLQRLFEDFPHAKHICIVAHGKFNKILLSHLLSTNDNNRKDKKASYNTSLEQGNTCINILDVNEHTNEWDAHIINFVDHIDEWQ